MARCGLLAEASTLDALPAWRISSNSGLSFKTCQKYFQMEQDAAVVLSQEVINPQRPIG